MWSAAIGGFQFSLFGWGLCPQESFTIHFLKGLFQDFKLLRLLADELQSPSLSNGCN